MRKVLYILFCAWLVTSCANNRKESGSNDMMVFEEAEMTTSEVNESLIDFNYEDLASQKLQDYFDLHLLEQNYPEFDNDITSQLKNTYNFKLNLPEGLQLKAVENIRRNGDLRQISDSIQHLSFYFDLVTNEKRIKDSITAVIRTSKITMDGSEVNATKVFFKNQP